MPLCVWFLYCCCTTTHIYILGWGGMTALCRYWYCWCISTRIYIGVRRWGCFAWKWVLCLHPHPHTLGWGGRAAWVEFWYCVYTSTRIHWGEAGRLLYVVMVTRDLILNSINVNDNSWWAYLGLTDYLCYYIVSLVHHVPIVFLSS